MNDTGAFLPLYALRIFKLIFYVSTLAFFSLSIYSCRSIIRKDICNESLSSQPDAALFISSTILEKETTKVIKGIGKITLWDSGGSQVSRAAWIGAADGRFRIEILGLPGCPVAKFIYDGKQYAFISTPDQKTFRESGSDSNLKPLTGINISSTDVILYLSGSVPLCDYDQAMFQDGSLSCRNILILKRKWSGTVEKLVLSPSHDHIENVEMYRWGRLAYTAELDQVEAVSGYQLPFHLVFSDGAQKGFSIDIEKCWPDAEINPQTFSIEPSDGF